MLLENLAYAPGEGHGKLYGHGQEKPNERYQRPARAPRRLGGGLAGSNLSF